jgi:ribosomal-protein-alanine N-acetyltransferase
MYALDLICFDPPFCFSRQTMRGFAEAPNATAILAETDGKLVGFCVAQVEERAGYVVTLDVSPESQRKGIARRLMAKIEYRARELGAESMALHVFTGNGGATRFYDALGYERLAVEEDFYGRGLDAFVYVKRFARDG